MDPEQLEAARRVGTTLCNKWTLEKLIGTGGMAAVYVAAHKIGRREAIKILHPDVARDPELRARFEQEAHAVNRFKHPGAVEIRDIDVTEDGAPFLVMELLEGEPLSEVARRPGGVALPDLLRWVDELLDVLAAAHDQGIIHRDIKPDNLFVMKDGHLKVLDFGIARVRADAPTLRTRYGATLGTAPYMPPEQIKGQEIDARADVFAVGATMFRLIAKRRIHETTNETETFVKMASEPAPPLGSVAPDAPRDVCFVVDRALMFDRANRYPDAATMQRDVRALREGKPPMYAHARLLEGTPAPSAMRAPSIVVSMTHAPMSGDEPTAYAAGGAVGVSGAPIVMNGPQTVNGGAALGPSIAEATAAASPVAIQQSVSGFALAGPVSSREPTTRPIQPADAAPVSMNGVNGAPLSSVGLEQSLAQAAQTPPSVGVMRPPGANTTMRSAGGPIDNTAAQPHGYAMPTGALAVAAPPAGATAGTHTQPAGADPLPPGATIPVIVPTRRTIAGQEPNVVLLVIVGVAFAALGVGLTLWIMLRGMGGDANAADAGTAASADPNDQPVDPWPRAPQRSPTRSNIGPSPQRSPQPQPQPQQPQNSPFPPGFTPSPQPGGNAPPGGYAPPPQSQPQPAPQPSPGHGKGKGKGKKD